MAADVAGVGGVGHHPGRVECVKAILKNLEPKVILLLKVVEHHFWQIHTLLEGLGIREGARV